MELRQLEYLLAVAQEGNFTRAAESVHVSQSALSQQIQVLEKELDTQLIDRSKRGAKLTAAGQVLQQHAQNIFHELGQAKITIQELEGLQRGSLHIGVVQTVNDYLMPTLMAKFSHQYPDVKLFVEELPSEAIEAGVSNGSLQLGFSFIPIANTHLKADKLFEERLALIIRHDHPLANEIEITVETLHDLPMVMLSNTFCTRQLWEETARLASAQPHITMELNTVSSILSVVEKVGLATILPEQTLPENTSSSLIKIKITQPTPLRQVGILSHKTDYLCAASRAFIQLAHATINTT